MILDKPIKAIIMAGGEGSRLRPLTLNMPKPLVPVNGIPAMSHILRLLHSHGVREAAVTLRFMGDMISSHYGESAEGISLKYYYEDSPLGTAGSVRAASRFCAGESDPFIVISGDAVCETDLGAAVDFHIKKNADVTLVLSRVDIPLEYGVVMCNSEGRVTRFLEKPSWKQAFSDTVNTGIYIISPRVMKLIPEGCAYDFGRQLFPRMLEEGRALYGFADPNYWCDIGSLRSYLDCNLHYSGGQSVIGRGCEMASDAIIMRSVVHDEVKIGQGAVLDGAIVCKGCTIGRNSSASPGSVIGAGCIVGENVRIAGGVRIYPGITLHDNTVVTGDILSQPRIVKPAVSLEDDRIAVPMPGGSAYAMRLGEAVGSVCGRVGVMSAPNDEARGLGVAFGSGVTLGGGECIMLGEGFASQAGFMSQRLYLPCTAYCTGEHVTLCDRFGLPLSRGLETAITSALNSGSDSSPRGHIPMQYFTRTDSIYTASLCETLSEACGIEMTSAGSTALPLDGLSFTFDDNPPSRLTAAVLKRFGAECGFTASSHALHIAISPDGHDIALRMGDMICDRWHTLGILIMSLGQSEIPSVTQISLPYSAPSALEQAAVNAGLKVYRRTDDSPHGIRRLAAEQLWMNDMCHAAVRTAALLSSRTLGELISGLPDFSTRVTVFDAGDEDKTRLMKKLCDADFVPDGEGVVYSSGRARIRVVPRRGRGFVLYADNDDAEVSDELTAMTRRVLGGDGK